MLKHRIITGLILLFGILGTLFLVPAYGFVFLIIVTFSLAAWEWARLASLQSMPARIVYALCIAVLAGLTLMFIDYDHGSIVNTRLRDVLGAGVLWWSFALLWVMTYPGSTSIWQNKFVRLFMGLFVLIPAITALSVVVLSQNGQWLFIYILGIVVAADVGAYCVGKLFGKHKLAPSVSPGKSWEGFFGGIASSMCFALLVGSQFSIFSLSTIELVVVTSVAALSSVLGDLLESMLKRHEGIKDSSQLLPGHGGLMDRIDSVTAAAPVFMLLVILLQSRAIQVV